MKEKSKYAQQIKSLRKNYVRFPLDLKPELLERFRAACTANGTTPTTEIKKAIVEYCERHEKGEVINADTIAAMGEAGEMEKHPEAYKRYSYFSELLHEVEDDEMSH